MSPENERKVIADERGLLLNAAEWLALEVMHHTERCTCGSCHAVAACSGIIESKNSKRIANDVRKRLWNLNA